MGGSGTAAEEQEATQPNTKVSTLLSSGVTTNKGRYFYYTKVRVRSRTRTQSVLRCACFSSELESSSVQVLACQALKLPAAVFWSGWKRRCRWAEGWVYAWREEDRRNVQRFRHLIISPRSRQVQQRCGRCNPYHPAERSWWWWWTWLMVKVKSSRRWVAGLSASESTEESCCGRSRRNAVEPFNFRAFSCLSGGAAGAKQSSGLWFFFFLLKKGLWFHHQTSRLPDRERDRERYDNFGPLIKPTHSVLFFFNKSVEQAEFGLLYILILGPIILVVVGLFDGMMGKCYTPLLSCLVAMIYPRTLCIPYACQLILIEQNFWAQNDAEMRGGGVH